MALPMTLVRKVLNKGFVKLVGTLGDELTLIQTAQVGLDQVIDDSEKKKRLISALLNNGHSGPFEHIVFTFHVKCPLFIAKQWMRPQLGSFNEMSSRHITVGSDFYTPVYFRKQMSKNAVPETMSEIECNELAAKFDNFYRWSYNFYKKLLDQGVTKEQARLVLPTGQFTQFYWTVHAKDLMTFIRTRTEKHTQWEMLQFVQALHSYFSELLPHTAEVFNQSYYRRLK